MQQPPDSIFIKRQINYDLYLITELSSDSERIERGHELTHTTGGLEHCLGKQKDNIGPSRSLPEESTSINVETGT